MENLNPFLVRHKENADMNQYWYSKATIQFMVQQTTDMCKAEENKESDASRTKKCAFLSTPSIYFSLKDKSVKEAAKVFDVSPFDKLNSDHRSTPNSPKTQILYITILTRTTRSLRSFWDSSIWLLLTHPS